jgi:GT2 family glycosyltransferase
MIGAGANMAFRRPVFDQLGFFDERLGAGAAGCSEDSEFWYRMLDAGLSIRYEPLAVVQHFHRIDEEGFSNQMEAYMRGHVFALLVQYEKTRHSGNLRRLFLSLPRYYWGVARGRLAGGERGTLRAEIRGCLSGLFGYLKSKLSASTPSAS